VEIVVLGAGGIGSVCAAHLACAGHRVRLVARGEQLRAVRERGLRIHGLADLHARPEAVERAGGACDLLVVATKTPDTAAALATVAELRPALALSLQNGVLKDAQLAAAFGPGTVIGAACMIGATRTAAGVAEYTLDGVTAVGELDAPAGARVRELAAAWNASGLHMRAVDDVLAHEWAKQALQAGAAPLAALTDLASHDIYATPPLARTLVELAREVGAVAAALGIELSDDESYGYDMRAIVTGPLDAAIAQVIARGEQLAAAGRTRIMLSMGQDMRARRPTEIEETVGHVVAEGDRLGVPVPALRTVYDVIRGIELAAGVRSAA
jgi:2-dehydropantoate 2-reductase